MHTPLLFASSAARRALALSLSLSLAGAAQAQAQTDPTARGASVGATIDVVINTGSPASPVPIAAGTYNNITITGTGAAILSGAVVVNGVLTVQTGGWLSTNCQSLTGGGSFTLSSNATLLVCDEAGLLTTGASGAVQVSGTRTFSNDASYIYNGTTAQVTGTGMPLTVRNLTVDKPSGTTLSLSQNVFIRRVLTMAGAGGLNQNSRSLILGSGAFGTALLVNQGTGTFTGIASVQRLIESTTNTGLGYRHIAAPVQNQTVTTLASGGQTLVVNSAYNSSATPTSVTPFPTVFRYDQSRLALTNNLGPFDKGWLSPTNTSESMLNRGYTVQLPSNHTLSFTGALLQGPTSIALSRASGATAADAGWNFIGNPYPSPLDVSTVQPSQLTNMNAAFYVFESTSQYGGQYRSYVNGFGNPIIGTGQAFFVRVSDGQTTGSLALNNANRVTDFNTSAPVRRGNDPRPQLTLELSGAGLTDALTVYAEAGATDGADAEFDAVKLPNSSGLNLASVAGSGQDLAIDGRAAFGPATLIPLTVQVPQAGAYVFRAEHLANLPAGLTLTLVDQHTGSRTPLSAGSTYTAQLSATPAQGRFVLETGSRVTSSAAAQAAQQVQLYPNPTSGQLTLLRPAHWGSTQVSVLNSIGQVVLRRVLPAADTQLDVQALPAGVYQLRLTTPQGAVTKRLVRQ